MSDLIGRLRKPCGSTHRGKSIGDGQYWQSMSVHAWILAERKEAADALSQIQADFELATKLRDEAVSDLYACNERIEKLEGALQQLPWGQEALDNIESVPIAGQDND